MLLYTIRYLVYIVYLYHKDTLPSYIVMLLLYILTLHMYYQMWVTIYLGGLYAYIRAYRRLEFFVHT